MSEGGNDSGAPSPPPPRRPPHILVFPYPAQGHIIPLLDLAYLLSLRGVSVTVLVTPNNLPLLSGWPDIEPLVLPFPPHPSLPDGAEKLGDVPSGGTGPAAMCHALGSLRGPILLWARSHPSPPDAILSDFFLGWTQTLAVELGVPRVTFYASGALAVSVINHVWHGKAVQEDAALPVPSSVLSFPEIPGSPSFPYCHLPSLYRRYRAGVPEWEFMKEALIANISSWGAVLNTFRRLEGAYLDHLMREHGHPRVWAVGPVLPPGTSVQQLGGQSSVPAADIIAWLDSHKAEASVVYLCFGSLFLPSRQQGAAIATALERSGVGFVWCVKDTTSRGGVERPGVVPEGFRERTAGRGLVIEGWAPQVAILRHPAVGSFVTHCGWNSVLEGLAAGVALLAWPMQADQFLNARLLVEEAGVAVRVCEGAESVPDPDELGRVLAESVAPGAESEWVASLRARAADMGRKAAEAVGEGGTSSVDLDGLVRELTQLRMAK